MPYFQNPSKEVSSVSPYSVRIRENADLNDSEYGQFLQGRKVYIFWIFLKALCHILKWIYKK